MIATESAGAAASTSARARPRRRKSWLALDADRAPVRDRRVLRDAVSIAAMGEVAEETAGRRASAQAARPARGAPQDREPRGHRRVGGGDRRAERPLDDEVRVASPAYLDEVGVAARRIELALGESGASPLSEAMKQAGLTIDGLAADIEAHYKLPLEYVFRPAIHTGFCPAITLRAAASSVAPVVANTSTPCVLASLDARDAEARWHHWKGH